MNTCQLIKNSQEKVAALSQLIPAKQHQSRVAEIDELMNAQNIWSDNRKAAALLKERQQLVSLLDKVKYLTDEIELLVEYAANFPEEIESLSNQALEISNEVENFELQQLLNGPHDKGAAILTISSGAGGNEAKNFVLILSRMYMRYADRMGWKIEILDEKQSEEHSDLCLDNISLQITGENAYGYLKGENGVMRLIRNSPFNANGLRHTSFAAVSVMPDVEDEIEIEVKESDVEIQAIRGSGPGGQATNKISSCVRLRHIPTGIMIKAQSERSQVDNKRNAFRILKAKLYEIELNKLNDEKNKIIENQNNAAFGSQIRTITLSPYQLVKNHKSGLEITQAEKVLDGDLHPLILDNLKAK